MSVLWFRTPLHMAFPTNSALFKGIGAISDTAKVSGLLGYFRQVFLISDAAKLCGPPSHELLFSFLNHPSVFLAEEFPFDMIFELFAGFPLDV